MMSEFTPHITRLSRFTLSYKSVIEVKLYVQLFLSFVFSFWCNFSSIYSTLQLCLSVYVSVSSITGRDPSPFF